MSSVTIFYSYAHEDEKLQQRLERHLSLLRQQGLISEWYDRQIVAGTNWAQAIDEHLNTASIILLLISPDFLASDYCYGVEMQRALERHDAGTARVIPVILRPVDWQEAPFAHLQCLPHGNKPVTRWSNRDEAFLDIALGIRTAIKELRSRSPLERQHPASPVSRQNRQRLLKRVRNFWIAGVLEQSLRNTPFIPLSLHEQPDAVANPWQLIMQESEQPTRSLPAGTHITQVYDKTSGGLLILGEPGTGKTTLLLELTRDLLDRAEHDEEHPMPFVFNLSSWAVKRSPLAVWLIEELREKYQVPYKVGQTWMDAEQILPLLDGLDEVDPAYRSDCADAINTYRRNHYLGSVVVCSRRDEYFTQPTRLSLDYAVLIQLLTAEQIDQYFSSAGKQLEAVQVAIRQDQMLQEFAATPLMLNILALTYQGTSIEDLAVKNSLQDQRQHILATYIQRMLQHRSIETRYTRVEMTRWLTWLAWQLVQHSQVEFYIERMQPDWLPATKFYRQWYGSVVRLGITLTAGLIICFCIGITVGLLVGAAFGPVVGLVVGLAGGLASGLVGGFGMGLASQVKPQIQLVEAIDWSWRRLVKISLLKERLLIAVSGSLAISFTTGLISLWSAKGRITFTESLIALTVIALIVVVATVLTNGLTSGVSGRIQDEHNLTFPNQGIKRSARISILLGLLSSLIGGMTGIAALSLIIMLDRPHFANVFLLLFSLLLFGSLVGTISGLTTGLYNGGIACIQHMILRLFLWQANFIPWSYPRFLDYAVERILLRKVGGSYIFVHRLFLDYFSSLYDRSVVNHKIP